MYIVSYQYDLVPRFFNTVCC